MFFLLTSYCLTVFDGSIAFYNKKILIIKLLDNKFFKIKISFCANNKSKLGRYVEQTQVFLFWKRHGTRCRYFAFLRIYHSFLFFHLEIKNNSSYRDTQ